MPKLSPKLLVIGLDGATFDLLHPWLEHGRLPTIARLLEKGAYGRLRSVPNTDTAPAWATFATGLNPANHTLFSERNWTPDRRTLYRVQGADRHGTAFWQIASDAGHTVIILNVPFTYPAAPVNGVLITGIDAPSTTAPNFCHPPHFSHQLQQQGITYQIDSDIQAAIKANRPTEGLAAAYQVARQRTQAMLYAMSHYDWQLAVIVYSLPDVMQHFFWQAMSDTSHPQHLAIRDGYTFMDEQIKRLWQAAGPDSNLLILSDHGFGPICATPAHLQSWLVQQGFTRLLDEAQRPLQQRLVSSAYDWIRHTLSEEHKAALRRWLPGVRNRVESDVRLAGIDWSKTAAYAGPSSWEIWINRQGREPQGIVGEDAYEQVREQIVAALLDWCEPQTGQKRIQAVHHAEAVYHGRFAHLAPDLTIEWNPSAAPPAATLEENISRFDGDHQPEGIFIAAGPSIRAIHLDGLHLTDVAPTILRLLNLTPDRPLDGRCLDELLKEAAP
jgi:predicted AlkP superfamily phosphohydrolase/phosphomutase